MIGILGSDEIKSVPSTFQYDELDVGVLFGYIVLCLLSDLRCFKISCWSFMLSMRWKRSQYYESKS